MSSETPPDDSPRRRRRGGAERAVAIDAPRAPETFVARRKAEGGAPTDF